MTETEVTGSPRKPRAVRRHVGGDAAWLRLLDGLTPSQEDRSTRRLRQQVIT